MIKKRELIKTILDQVGIIKLRSPEPGESCDIDASRINITADTIIGTFVPKEGESVNSTTAEKLVIIMREASSVEEALEKASEFIQLIGEQDKRVFASGPLLSTITRKVTTKVAILLSHNPQLGTSGPFGVLGVFIAPTVIADYQRFIKFIKIFTPVNVERR